MASSYGRLCSSPSRSSHEERGLKFAIDDAKCVVCATSLLSRGAWIEIINAVNFALLILSLLSRGAWIEIFFKISALLEFAVAPLTRSVD